MKQDYPRRALSHDSWPTDRWLAKIFDGWFDPCPLNPNYIVDGLERDWRSKTFVNPPYSNPMPWVKKAIYESQLDKTIVMLLKHDSSTKWYQLLHEAGARFLPIQGRLKYGMEKTCAFPSVLVIL